MLKSINLSCVRNNKILFKNLSFNLQQGELGIVLGANGSGKSSLLKIIAGLLPYKKGTIKCNSTLLYIGHNNCLQSNLSVFQNLFYLLNALEDTKNYNSIKQALKFFDLEVHTNKLTGHLSFGQQKKINLTRLLLQNKQLWLLDEPFSALDKHSSKQLKLILNKHLRQGGAALIATHNANDCVASNVIELNL